MKKYLLKRLLLIIPTLIGILGLNFIVIQCAPGGPIEQVLTHLKNPLNDTDTRLYSAQESLHFNENHYQGSEGIDPAFLKKIEQQFGFDQPLWSRFFLMIKSYCCFDLGKSYFKNTKVVDIILQKLPVSVSLGFWTTFFIYAIAIPLGMFKARIHGSKTDTLSSLMIVILYSIPSFLLALCFISMFSGSGYFPLRGLISDHFDQLSLWGKIKDYAWHIFLPVCALVISGFSKITILIKNSFLEEMTKPYVLTALSKGLTDKQVLMRHVFKNAILVIVAGFPQAFLHLLFTSSLLIEVLFSLDGLGLLGFEATLNRDYPLIFGILYVLTLLGLALHLIGDVLYMFIDPRVDLNQSRS
jgi:microcin C transport system permease protein